MPSKGKRVAVRQGNLSRRRSNRSSGGGPASAAAHNGAGSVGTITAPATPSGAGTTAGAAAPTGSTSTTARPGSAAGRPANQPRGRRHERPAAYNHVGSELIRIGIFASVLLAALIAISFVI